MSNYVMTYDSLLESVKRWVIQQENEQLELELPRMIDSAERKVARALKTLLSIKYATTNFVQGENLIAKPARWLETVSFQYEYSSTEVRTLYERTYEFITTVFPDRTDQGAPEFYSDFEFGQFYVGKTPDSNYPFQVGYYERPEPLCVETQQNWLTINAPDLLLYGTLLETAPFLINNMFIPVWQQKYDTELQRILEENSQRITDRSQEARK